MRIISLKQSKIDKRKPKKQKLKKFRLLLDTAFAESSLYSKLYKLANLKHCRHDFNLSREAEDEYIYTIAVAENRIVLTQDGGFKKQVKPSSPGVIIAPSYITRDEMDTVISDFLRGKNPDDFMGKATKI